jgi:hypothetical protein
MVELVTCEQSNEIDIYIYIIYFNFLTLLKSVFYVYNIRVLCRRCLHFTFESLLVGTALSLQILHFFQRAWYDRFISFLNSLSGAMGGIRLEAVEKHSGLFWASLHHDGRVCGPSLRRFVHTHASLLLSFLSHPALAPSFFKWRIAPGKHRSIAHRPIAP